MMLEITEIRENYRLSRACRSPDLLFSYNSRVHPCCRMNASSKMSSLEDRPAPTVSP